MTSALSMQIDARDRPRRTMINLLSAALMVAVAGCASPRLAEPRFLESPYVGAQVWAVAPFTNESGVTHVDRYRVADIFAQQVQDVRGVNVVPVNRVIIAMRELEMEHITGPSDARLVMNTLGVDGLIVGTITAYDPYRPMTLGVAVELHLAERSSARVARSVDELDTWKLTRSPTELVAPAQFAPIRRNPIVQAAGVFDASNHRTLADLEAYASGRSMPESAYGRDIYLVSMDMYTQFVSFRLLRDLLAAEQNRIASEEAVESSQR